MRSVFRHRACMTGNTVEARVLAPPPPATRTWDLLTIDDSRLLHAIVARYLDGTEFRLAGRAMDGGEALEAARSCRPDVILLDVVMPGVSGPEALALLREWNPGVRVIMASSVGTEEAVQECLRAGAAGFLTKPFNRDDLLAGLRRAVAAA